jgi:Putative beta-barrel porin-2, OmpL-like. bbp2/Carboxypeptidase regulatory-like domain
VTVETEGANQVEITGTGIRHAVRRSLAAAMWIVVVAAGFASLAQAAANNALMVSQSGSVSGTTRNAHGEALPRVTITAHRVEGEVDRTVISGAAGGFGFEGLKPGLYTLTASNEGPNPPATVVEVAAGKSTQADVIAANAAAGPDTTVPATTPSADHSNLASEPALPPAVARALEAMQARIEQLEMELKNRSAAEPPAPAATVAPARASEPPTVTATPNQEIAMVQPQGESTIAQPSPAQAPAPPAVDTQTPFAYADWTWLNGTPRNKDAVWDSKFFTPEIRFDTNFVSSFNHPQDDTIGGSSEIFRSNEIQVEQISFGGDFHWQNVRGRVLTMNGMFGVTTPRNDSSPGRGQWDLRGAYKYVSEAYGGYHWNVNHGLNVDAGIFVSYIGLFSYYNFDNWAYQPSYVSSNTPWFFNGLRIQWFPTNKLKIEPWIINGWQSYGRIGSRPGLGGQILYRPAQWISLVFNNYGMGEDTLGAGNGKLGRSRIHTDDSVEIKYYDHPEKTLDKMAFSLTGDLGCEYGGGVSCFGNTKDATGAILTHKQAFLGWMLYNRWQFKKDTYGLTIGGGAMNNPGRYLVLLPPINGADAISGSPYFTQNPGDPFKAWDGSITFDWMPKQYITFRWEYGYRHANVPYFSGRGGITPGVNTSTSTIPNPAAGSLVPGTTFVPGPFLSPTPGFTCVAGSGFCPDLRKDEGSLRLAIMVKF